MKIGPSRPGGHKARLYIANHIPDVGAGFIPARQGGGGFLGSELGLRGRYGLGGNGGSLGRWCWLSDCWSYL
jgi:hypothetical protein